MFNKLVELSMDLYTIHSDIVLSMSADILTIDFNDGDHKVELWIDGGMVFPQIVHDHKVDSAIELEELMKILSVVQKYV